MYDHLLKCAKIFSSAADVPDWLIDIDKKMQERFKDPAYVKRVEDYDKEKLYQDEQKEKKRKQDILEEKLDGRWIKTKFNSSCIFCNDIIQSEEKAFLSEDGPLHPSCCGYLKKERKQKIKDNDRNDRH